MKKGTPMDAGPRDKAGQALEDQDRLYAEAYREMVRDYKAWQEGRFVRDSYEWLVEDILRRYGDPTTPKLAGIVSRKTESK
jgi:hypothetical protein